MKLIRPEMHTRRAFLRRSGQLAMAGTALPFALNMAAMGEAAAFNATDYKALVCIFLNGGNDYANTVVTYDDASYARYLAIRGGDGTPTNNIAIPRASLAATLLNPTTALPNGRQYALHPSMTGMTNLFNTGKLAVQLNVGPLIAPLTRAEYNNRSVPRPPQLFSHNDQQSVWQTSAPEGSTTGWGGHIGDLALSSNGNSLFTCISVGGNAVFLAGDQALNFRVGSGGSTAIRSVTQNVYGSAAVQSALTQLVRQPRTQVLENEYNKVVARSIDSQVQIGQTLADGLTKVPDAAFPSEGLATQLRTVARLIAGRDISSAKRQVFFVSMGGFDLHDNLINGQTSLMTRLSAAMSAFYAATESLGIADKVTCFTASDFGRTLQSNGDGSDHGWGGHHFVMGGAVRGKAFYGSAPPVSVTNSTTAAEDQWHVGQGRLLPTTSVDQYAATMARWFGVADNEMAGILPNLTNFNSAAYPRNLGFMG